MAMTALNTADTQPNNIFFDLEIGGLRRIYEMPQTPLALNVSLTPAIGRFSVSLLDDSGYDVEPYLWGAQGASGIPKGIVQWGYTGRLNVASPRIPFQLVRYAPTIGRNEFTLELEGFFTFSEADHNSGILHGTLKEIIETYSERYDLVVDLDELGAASQLGLAQGPTTELKEKEFYKDATESDHSFLKRIVDKFGVSAADGKAGFWTMTTVDTDPSTGQPRAVLKIKNPERVPNEYTWRVQGEDSVVLSWAPDISFIPHAVLGGGGLVVNSHQDITDHEMAIAYNEELAAQYSPKIVPGGITTDVKPVTGRSPRQAMQYPMEAMDPDITDHAVKVVGQPGYEPQMALLDGLNTYLQGQSYLYQGILTIIGDPRVQPARTCVVDYRLPSSTTRDIRSGRVGDPLAGQIRRATQHYTAGLYFIDSVTHSITPGQYTTTLNLRREAHPFSPVTQI